MRIVLEITGKHCGVALCPLPVDIIPCEESAVLSVIHIIAEGGFREKCVCAVVVWCGGEEPCVRRAEVYSGLRGLEVIDITRSLRAAALLPGRNQLCEFGVDIECGWCCGVDRRDFVYQICEPHEVLAEGHVETPHGVVDDLVAEIHLFC